MHLNGDHSLINSTRLFHHQTTLPIKPEMEERTVLHYEYKRTRNHLLFLVCFKMAINMGPVFLRTSIAVGLINKKVEDHLSFVIPFQTSHLLVFVISCNN